MGNRLYVGNLPYTVTDDQLKEVFAPHGEVTSASVVMDRATGRSRGFGFVEMSTPEQATKATEQMNGALFEGRPLTVNEARERAPRTGGPRPFNGGDRGGFRPDGGGDRGPPRGPPPGDRGGAGGNGGGWGGGDRGAPPADRGGWGGDAAGGRGPDKRRERDRSDRDEGGRGGRGGGGGGGGRGGW